MIFGQTNDTLVEGLERLRKYLCAYGADLDGRCDCKYGASMKGEQTGCPELRQAIKYLTDRADDVVVMDREHERRAIRALDSIRRVLDAAPTNIVEAES